MSSDTLPRHAAYTPEEGIHGVVAGYIADATDWAAGTVSDPPSASTRTVDAADAGKVFWRVSDNTLWWLVDNSPLTWKQAEAPTPLAHNTASPSAGSTLTINASLYNSYTVTLPNGAVTIAFSNVPSGVLYQCRLVLIQPASGTGTVTWPGSTRHVGGSAYGLSATVNVRDKRYIETDDGGTSWYLDMAGNAWS